DAAWQDAARAWEQVVAERPDVQPNSVAAAYALGLCYRKLGQNDDAARVWESLRATSGDASQAVRCRLAELRLAAGDQSGAADLFEAALADVKAADAFRNNLLGLDELRALLEAGCEACREAGAYEPGRRLADVYSRVAAG